VQPITAISSREVYRNAWMTMREDVIRRADGSTGIYCVIDKPTYALIIAADGDRVALVEQFRYPLGERRCCCANAMPEGVTVRSGLHHDRA